MAVVAKFKLTERVSRAGWAFTEEHFADGSACRHGVSYSPDDCDHGYWGSWDEFTFEAATDEDANAVWAAATPSGKLKMTIANPAAVRQLEVGAMYTLTLQKSRS